MPVYQYACTECGHQLEARQSFTDDPLTACPTCEGRLRKVLSAVGVVFKGSGFYRTDSRKDTSGPSKTSTGDKSSGTSDGGPGKGSESGSSSGGSDKKTPASTGAGSSSSSTSAAT